MSRATTERLLQQLRRLLPEAHPSASDRQLLDQFIATRDPAAFTTLLERHGAMVLGVCRRVLGDVGAVEDVFQATFLVLTRQAGAIRRRDTVGGWLYGVARRLAHKALAGEARRRRHERQAAADRVPPPGTDPGWQELLSILDEELARLPEPWRAPLLACYLEGRTQDEAARQLGWSLSTLRRRLARGREVLRLRMSRRGATLSAALFAGVLAPRSLTGAVPARLTEGTIHLVSTGGPTGVVPSAVAALAERSAAAGWRVNWTGLAVLLVVAVAAGAWSLQSADERPAPEAPASAGPPMALRPPTDLYGDPLPPGAIARMGTTAFRHMEAVSALVYSPDGKWLATAGNDYTVRVWETASGREAHRFSTSGLVYWKSCLAISPDSQRLAATTGNGMLHVWNLATGKPQITRRAPAKGKFWTFFPAFRADGRAVFLFHGDGKEEPFALYDAQTGTRLCLLDTGEEDRMNLACSAGMLANCRPTQVDLLSLDTGKVVRVLRFPGKRPPVALAFARDGRRLATWAGGLVQIWDPATGTQLHQLAHPAPDQARRLSVAVSPDGKQVALGGYPDHSLRLVDVADGKERVRLQNADSDPFPFAFSPDGRSLVAADDTQARIWDAATGKPREPERASHRLRVTAVAFAPDGRRLISGSRDGSVRLWDARTGRQLGVWHGGRAEVSGVAFSPDGRSLLITTATRTLVLDAVRLAEGLRINAPAGTYQAAVYSPDGRLLAAPGPGGAVCLRRTSDGTTVHTLDDHGGESGAMAFSPDGRLLAVCHKRKLRLWDVASGEELKPLEGEPYAYLLAFSPDGQILAAGGYETITLWRVATRKKIGDMNVAPPDRLELHGLGYTPDGRMLVLSGWNQRYTESDLRLWEVATCQERFRVTNPGGPSFAIAFAPDGRTMATGNSDGTVTVWDLAVLRHRAIVPAPSSRKTRSPAASPRTPS